MQLVCKLVCLLFQCLGGTMSAYKFDTFENEAEIDQMIKKFQDKSMEYLKTQDTWDSLAEKPTVS